MKVDVIGNREGRLCVFNCLDSVRGREIYREMIEWLAPMYEVHVVWHDGSKFEYEGIKYMQELLRDNGGACLYLHTKGACNHPINSKMVREMWRREFGDRDRARAYWDVAYNHYGSVVVCPFSGADRLTRYNGFVVNHSAMELIDVVETSDRLWYERMFADTIVNIMTMKYWGSLKVMHRILELEYLK